MRTISNNTQSAAASDSIYNESSATLSISGLTEAEVAPIQISGDNVNFVNYYEGGSLVQLSAGAASKSLAYPGYYRVSVPIPRLLRVLVLLNRNGLILLIGMECGLP